MIRGTTFIRKVPENQVFRFDIDFDTKTGQTKCAHPVQMVYLVDDDIDDLELVKEALEGKGFNGIVACANNGEEFLSKLERSNLPELVVLDLNMPLKDGFEVLKEMKKSRHFSVVPVIVLTSSQNKQDETKCFDLGCNLFLTKPSTLEEYNALASKILDVLYKIKGN